MSGTVRESPADFGNGDLISRLLAATPPYQTNSTFVPPGLYFSEMLKRFVQAKSCAAAAAAAVAANAPPLQQTPGKRGRKRSWKDCGGKGVSSSSLPPDQSEAKAPRKPPAEHHRQLPLWYPPFYPAAYPPPVYFKAPEAAEPLDLQTRAGHADPVLHKQPDRHRSAFRVPEPRGSAAAERRDGRPPDDNRRGTSYLMGNLTEIFRQAAPLTPQSSDEEKIIVDVEGDGPEVSPDRPEEGEKKNCKDLTALIGLELVVDYVKHGGNKGDPNGLGANKCCQNS